MSPFSGTGGGGADRVNLWPILYHNNSGTSILWPLIDVDDRGFAIRPLVEYEDSRMIVLFFLYRHTKEGEAIRRSFFPFMTWDTAPGKSSFSFSWRVFERHRDGERSGGHILFIPYGDP